jgi:hypothetical protein
MTSIREKNRTTSSSTASSSLSSSSSASASSASATNSTSYASTSSKTPLAAAVIVSAATVSDSSSTSSNTLKTLNEWKKHIDNTRVFGDTKTAIFFRELERSPLSSTEKIELFKYPPHGMRDWAVCISIAMWGGSNTIMKFLNLIEESLRSPDVSPNSIAKLMALKNSRGETFFMLAAEHKDSAITQQCVILLTKLIKAGADRELITKLWALKNQGGDTIYLRYRTQSYNNPASLYQLADSGLLSDGQCKGVASSNELILQHILENLEGQEKKDALGRCLDENTYLGKVFYVTTGFFKPTYKDKSECLRKAFVALFKREPDNVTDSDFEKLMAPIRKKNRIASNSSSSSSSVSATSVSATNSASTANTSSNIPLSAPVSVSDSSSVPSNSLKTLDDWKKHIDKKGFWGAAVEALLFRELQLSSLSSAEKLELLKYPPQWTPNWPACIGIAMRGADTTKQLLTILESLRNSGNSNTIAELMALKNSYGCSFHSLCIHQKDPATLYQFANNGLLLDEQYKDLAPHSALIFQHIFTLEEQEKQSALIRWADKETPLGKVFAATLSIASSSSASIPLAAPASASTAPTGKSSSTSYDDMLKDAIRNDQRKLDQEKKAEVVLTDNKFMPLPSAPPLEERKAISTDSATADNSISSSSKILSRLNNTPATTATVFAPNNNAAVILADCEPLPPTSEDDAPPTIEELELMSVNSFTLSPATQPLGKHEATNVESATADTSVSSSSQILLQLNKDQVAAPAKLIISNDDDDDNSALLIELPDAPLLDEVDCPAAPKHKLEDEEKVCEALAEEIAEEGPA